MLLGDNADYLPGLGRDQLSSTGFHGSKHSTSTTRHPIRKAAASRFTTEATAPTLL